MSIVAVAPPAGESGRSGNAHYFGASHSVAAAARRACRLFHRLNSRELMAGGVACAEHWDAALWADARVAEQFGLDSQPPVPDNDLVDEVAVDRALNGEKVALTAAERREFQRRRVVRSVAAGRGARRGRLLLGRFDRAKRNRSGPNVVSAQPVVSGWLS